MRKRIKHKNVVGGVVANHRQPDGVETIANRSLGLGGAQRLEREKSPVRSWRPGWRPEHRDFV
jgi:hypothetical protein